MKRLEEIVKKLEKGELSLDSALELFEEGIKLSRFCHTKLEQAERKVEILLKNNRDSRRRYLSSRKMNSELNAFFESCLARDRCHSG